MSDDSAPDKAQDAPEQSTEPSSASVAETKAPKRSNLRQMILFGLLALMVGAFAYDYRIVRPSVDRAYEQITQLNDAMNSSATSKPTLNTDIHREIDRKPARSYTEGPYHVEVFSWTAGLPFRTHDLYAIYTPNGDDYVFMRHYKFALPEDELTHPVPATRPGDEIDQSEEPDDGGGGGGGFPPFRDIPGGPGGPGGDGEGEGRPQRPDGDSEEENSGAEEGSVSPDDTPEGDAPPADKPEEDAPPADKPEGDAPPADKPEGDAPPADKPEGDAPPADRPEEDAPPADKPAEAASESSPPEKSAPEADAADADEGAPEATTEPAEESAEATPPADPTPAEAEKTDP